MWAAGCACGFIRDGTAPSLDQETPTLAAPGYCQASVGERSGHVPFRGALGVCPLALRLRFATLGSVRLSLHLAPAFPAERTTTNSLFKDADARLINVFLFSICLLFN